jgi:hypothetical protein
LIVLDERHALVAKPLGDRPTVTEIQRGTDSDAAYLLRVAREAADCDRLVVAGDGGARLAFEREWVSLYHRPDCLVDLEAPTGTAAALVRKVAAAPAR